MSVVEIVAGPKGDLRPRVGGGLAFARTIVKKLGGLVITMLVTSFLVFMSMYLAPGNPVSFLVGGRGASPETIRLITKQYGLDQPPLLQYLHWLGNMLQGNLGVSLKFRENVSTLLEARLPTTLGLVMMSAAIIIIIGLAAGIVAALNNGRMKERLVSLGLSFFAAVPPFVSALVLVSLFAVTLGWFPAFGAGHGGWDTVYHLILPAIALSISFIALVGRVTQAAALDELGREHVEVAVSRGLTYPGVIRRHVLRNAVQPIVTVTGLVVAGLIVSSTIIESAFGLSGIGSLLVQAVNRKDFAVVQAIIMIVVLVFVVANTIVDLLAPVLDPRAATGASAR
jgi:peptide/nickel transport system permease protein